MSPTALIPFCDLGGNLSAMGVKIDQFDVSVCNSFKEKLVEDQLCYEVDPNLYIYKDKFDMVLVIDYNEDRQIYLDDETKEARKVQTESPFRDENSKNDYFVYLETIGTNFNSKCLLHSYK